MRKIISFLLLAQSCLAALNAANYPTFKACVEDAIAKGECTINLPPKINSAYLVDAPLPAWPNGRLTIRGEGDGSMLYLRGAGRICIEGCVLRLVDCRVYGDPQDVPDLGVCFRRNESGPRKAQSINGCGLDNVTVNGSFKKMSVLVLCAEGSVIFRSRINNSIGHGLVYDSNDRYQLGYVTDSGLFTNTGHNLIATEIAVWNSTAFDVFPLVIAGFTDSLVAQGVYITSQKCRAYCVVESYPTSYNRGNVPRWNRLESAGWETKAGAEPKYGILYRRLGGQIQYPETLKNVPAIRWQSGPASGQETVE